MAINQKLVQHGTVGGSTTINVDLSRIDAAAAPRYVTLSRPIRSSAEAASRRAPA
jgi:hypothetical protein